MPKKTKICVMCKKEKPLSEFHKNNGYLDGRKNKCTLCANLIGKEYSRTKHGVLMTIWHTQNRASIARQHSLPNYLFDELKDWCLTQEKFHELYDNWVKSGYLKDLKPSIDRKDNYKSYTFDNIQLMTWAENKEREFEDMRNGKLIVTSNPQKPVLQFDLDGNFIKEYSSASEASRIIKSCDQRNISAVCLGKRKTTGGFIWKFKNL